MAGQRPHRTAPHRLEQWRQIILRAQQSPEGLTELLALLRDRSPETERLRDFAPFAGVLIVEERLHAKPKSPYHF